MIIMPQGSVRQTPMQIYVDEVKLTNKSGIIQTAFPFVLDNVVYTIEQRAKEIVTEFFQPTFKEFKGGDISESNKNGFLSFIKVIRDGMVNMKDMFNVHPIITLLSNKQFKDTNTIRNMIAYVNQRISSGPALPQRLVEDFCCQIYWLYRILKHICPEPVKYDFEIIFDSQGTFHDDCNKVRLALQKNSNTIIASQAWEFLTSLANDILTQLNDAHKDTPLYCSMLPSLQKFIFIESSTSHSVQASDLLGHLFYNALKSKLGDTSDLTTMKTELFLDVLSGEMQESNPIDEKTSKSFHLIKKPIPNSEKIDYSVLCTNDDLLEVFTLL